MEMRSNLPSKISSDEAKANNEEVCTKKEEKLSNEVKSQNLARENNQVQSYFKKLVTYIFRIPKFAKEFVIKGYLNFTEAITSNLFLQYFLFLLIRFFIFPMLVEYMQQENCPIETKKYYECEF